MTMGQSIKKIRKERGLTLLKLSEKSGVSTGTLLNWEKDYVMPTIFNLICVADVFKVSLDELVGREVRNR